MGRKLIAYDIATGRNVPELRMAVELGIKAGWEPVGGLAMDNDGEWYCQAMVKYESEAVKP